MQRDWLVGPDETGVVSQAALAEAVMDGVIALDRLGGTLNVYVDRVDGRTANEKFTVAAIVSWRNDPNAKPQPESTEVRIVPALEDDAELTPEELSQHFPEEPTEAEVAALDEPLTEAEELQAEVV